jgi:HSP20 family protein
MVRSAFTRRSGEPRGAELGRRDAASTAYLSPYSVLRGDLETFFDDLWRRRHPGFESAANFFPALDVSETADGYRVTADLPGLRREDVTVSAEGDALVISGARTESTKDEGRNYLCRECVSGEFRRVVELTDDADLARATASMRDGVLTVNVPRDAANANRRRVIPIESAAPATGGDDDGPQGGRNPT